MDDQVVHSDKISHSPLNRSTLNVGSLCYVERARETLTQVETNSHHHIVVNRVTSVIFIVSALFNTANKFMSTVQARVLSIRGGSVNGDIWRRWKRIVNKGITTPGVPSDETIKCYSDLISSPEWSEFQDAQRLIAKDYMR